MSCQGFEELLSAYLDDELAPQEKASLEQHLATCDSCRSVLAELMVIKEALKAAPLEELPLGLHDSIMAKVADSRKGFRERILDRISGWTYRQWIPAMAGAMVFVMLVSAGGSLWLANNAKAPRNQAGGYEGTTYSKADDGMSLRSISPTSQPTSPEANYGAASGAELTTKSMLADTDRLLGTGDMSYAATQQKIIKRAQLSLEVSRGKVKETSELAVNVVKANFGYVESSSMAESQYEQKEYTNFYMVARVPAENLEPVVDQITALGHTLREDTSGQDVTDVYVDLEARLRNKENQEQRLLTIMGEAETVGELLQVEGELSRVRGEIESMKAQKDNYDKQVALSTVSLTLTEEGAIKPIPSPWIDVWNTFVYAWRTLLIAIAKMAPAIITLGIVVGVIAVFLRRRRTA